MLKKLNNTRIRFFSCFILLMLFSPNILKVKEISLEGKSIGTSYKIKILYNRDSNHKCIKIATNKFLTNMDKSLSMYNKVSEVNYFNFSLKSYFSPSNNFITLLFISKILCNFSEGLWNPSINSINSIWRLNQKKIINKTNYIFNFSYLLDKTDFNTGIDIKKNGYINKKNINVSIDFSSIAKGFIVDQIALFFKKKGFKNFLIELGGEIYSTTENNICGKWNIGIFSHSKKNNVENSINSVYLKNKAIATSGNYNNYTKYSKIILPHIINPITGNPISNLICSVSVIANNCTIADSLATILMLVNPKDSIYLINSLENIECILTTTNYNGLNNKYLSNGFF